MSAHGGSDLLRSLVSKWRDYRATLASLRELESSASGVVAEMAGELGLRLLICAKSWRTGPAPTG